jgi:putative transcriptional regulator
VSKDKRLSPLGAEIVAGMSAFCDALEAGEAMEKRFTVRTVSLDLEVKQYGPEDVKKARKSLNASQPLLAKFLGISVKTIRSWEQGIRPVPAIACRYLDDILAFPELFRRRIRMSTSENSSTDVV